MRNAARAELMKQGKVHKGDGKDVDHTKPLDLGGSNSKSNLRVVSESKNRSFKRDSKGSLVSQTSSKESKRRR
jgi:5-methylcytosine-specific restriction endonuclease McrA